MKFTYMANHKSAQKRIRSDEKKRLQNRLEHKTARNAIKKLKEVKTKKREHLCCQMFLV